MRLSQLLRSSQMKYFQRYVEREMNKDYLRRTWDPISGWKEIKKKNWYYGEHRPWTDDFKRDNQPGTGKRMPPVQPVKEWSIFKGDRVEILVGKDKGKQGIINSIIKERNWCYVEGLNCEYKKVQQNPNFPPTCVKEEKPLMITSQVKLVDPSDELGTDIEWRYTETGERVRVSLRSGYILPMPTQSKELDDFVLPSAYSETEKDTKDYDIKEVTFKPKAMTFDEEIMDSLNIKETRKRGKVYYW